jgi:hypothetical protein
MTQEQAPDRSSGGRFGKCCDELKEALEGEEFEPLISVGPEDILYLAVGLIELEDEEPGMIDHPLYYCPFCGAKLQDAETVKAQLESVGEVQQ